MNMILHDCATAEIWNANTLTSPHFKQANGQLKTHDYVVANPPFSDKAWGNGMNAANDEFYRFPYGVPPKKNGDYAYLLHVLASLKSTGRGAIILPHGVLFRGGAEADIRREIVKRGFIKGIIGLPANLFYGTGIPACIVVLDKSEAATRKGIFMIDSSKGFIKDGNKNRLREQDIHKIVDTFNRQAEVQRYSRLVPSDEISDSKNDFNLNLTRYIDSAEPEDLQDIDAHLRGGIPNRDLDALERYWQVIPGVRAALFKRADRPGYSELKVPVAEIKPTIFGHPEFTSFNEAATKMYTKWQKSSVPLLKGLKKGGKPKALIETISENLLEAFRHAPLLDAYDVYQRLMDYWAETMQDDAYLIAGDGWIDAARPRQIIEEKGKKSKEKPDFSLGKLKFKTELIPPTLIIARYFATEQAEIDKLEAEVAALSQEMEEMAEEHGGEEGLLAEAMNDKDKITKSSVAARLKAIKDDPDAEDERKLLTEYLALAEKDCAASEKLSHTQEALTRAVAAKYGKLSEDDIKIVVVEDKWLAALATAINAELDRISLALAGRIRELAERYATPLPKLSDELAVSTARVRRHLEKMGAGLAPESLMVVL
jgi:type I restriction enzyme M protein